MKKYLILIVSFWVLCLFSACENNTASNSGYYETYEDLQSFETTAAETELPQNLFYNEISISTLLNDLQGNALKAKRTYLNERLAIHGLISGSGSNAIGDFVRVKPNEDSWDYIVCYFTDDSQIDEILDKNEGDPITIKGIVTEIDEFSGYSINIEDIYAVRKVYLHRFYKETNLGDDIQIFGIINDVGKSGNGDNRTYFIYIQDFSLSYSDITKVKCILTTDEQIDMVQNAKGYRITVQGKVSESEGTGDKRLEVKYITNLSEY